MTDDVKQLQKIVEKQQKEIDRLSGQHKSIFGHLKVGIIHLNEQGKFLEVNKKFCDFIGYTQDELYALTFKDITYKEDLERDLPIYEKSKIDGSNGFTLEKRYVRKDGRVVWAEIFITHQKDEEGTVLSTLGIVTDITKRKKIHETIIDQTRKMQLYLDLVDVMIVAMNRQGNITLVNRKACEVLGFEEHNILGKNWFNNFISPSQKDKAIEYFLETISGKKELDEKLKYKVTCKDNKERIILWRRAYVYDSKKRIAGLISSGEDITELIKLEEENRKSEQALFNQAKLASMGEMIRNIAHQWRQPLSTISTVASGIKLQKELDTLEDKDFNSSMDAIVDTTQYLSQTIDDFQNFFKMDSKTREFSCKDLLDNVKNLISSSYKSNNIDFIIENHGICLIKGPYNEIIQVIINILNNSKDAFDNSNLDNKVVVIQEHYENEKLYITIKDNAGGIPDDIINRVFEPYFTTKHQSIGTGIGLYMVKDIVENRLEGQVEVYNDILDFKGIKRKGAVFKLTIPLQS